MGILNIISVFRRRLSGAIKRYLKYSVSGTFLKRIAANGLLSAHEIKRAKVDEVRGKSIVWNQLFTNPNFDGSDANAWRFDDGTNTYENNTLKCELSGSGSSIGMSKRNLSIPANHKLYFCFDLLHSVSSLSRVDFIMQGSGGSARKSFTDSRAATANEWATYAGICTSSYNTALIGIRVTKTDMAAGDYIILRNAKLIDLTLEQYPNIATTTPTVAEVEEWLRTHINTGLKPYYPYNAGEIVNTNLTGFKTILRNQLKVENNTAKAELLKGKTYKVLGTRTSVLIDGSAVTITDDTYTATDDCEMQVVGYSDDTRVYLENSNRSYSDVEPYTENTYPLDVKRVYGKLNGEGSYVKPYPEGMRGAGSVGDELDLNGDSALVKVENRAYESGDESDATVVTDKTTTNYALATPLEYTNLMYDTSVAGDGSQLVPLSALKLNVDADGVEMQTFPVDGDNVTSMCGEVTIDYEYRVVLKIKTA